MHVTHLLAGKQILRNGSLLVWVVEDVMRGV
jgi:hypothetical protein